MHTPSTACLTVRTDRHLTAPWTQPRLPHPPLCTPPPLNPNPPPLPPPLLPPRDELRAAWAIFTPLLQHIDAGGLPLHPYPYGSRGPAEADELLARTGYVRNAKYDWHGGSGGTGAKH